MSFLVFDIETVPDLTLWNPGTAKKKRGATDDEQPFAPLYAHRPIAIGYVLLNDDLEVVIMGSAGTTGFGDDEAKLLTAWNTFAASAPGTLVSYNGRGFDLPVLSLRALRHGVPTGWYSSAHRKKYSEDMHIDLFEQFTEYGTIARNGFSLDTMAKVVGLPGKLGFDGSMVAAAYANGKAKEIEAYCLSDTCQTALLLMRYQLMRGRIGVDQFRHVAEVMLNTCGGRGMEIVEKVDRKRFLLQAP